MKGVGLQAKSGDKVKLKRTSEVARGTILRIDGRHVLVQLDGSEKTLRLTEEGITNLSLAARKAWATRPNRRVGRKPGVRTSDRVSVTLRINRELWKQFRELENAGLIQNRTEFVAQALISRIEAAINPPVPASRSSP